MTENKEAEIKELLPPPNFVQRDLGADVHHILDTYADFIAEAVDFGCKILFWEPKEDHDGSPVSPMFLRQFIEMLDGIEILVRNGAAEITKAVVRSAFELNLYIHFLQEGDSTKRNYSFLVLGAMDRIKYLEKLKPGNASGAEMSKHFKSERIIVDVNDKIPIETIDAELQKTKEYLEGPEFVPIIEEYERLKAQKKKNMKWYSLFGGADNIQNLAKMLNKYTYYEILYREWSGTVHGSNIFNGKMQQSSDGNLAYYKIRLPAGLCFMSKMACDLAINSFGYYVLNRHPGQLDKYNIWQADFMARYEAVLDHEHISINRE